MASSIGELKFLQTNTFLDSLCGGIPFERITEIFGEEKVGKSTLCLQIIAAAQKEGLKCMWVDVEHSFTKEYAESLGVDTSKLGLIREEVAENYIDKTEEEIRSGKWNLIVLDSIGDLSSRAEFEKSAGEKTIGVQASLMTVFSRKLAVQVSYRKLIFIGINHSRIDIMKGNLYTMGGKKWSEKKKLSIRLKEKPGFVVKNGEKIVGKVIVATVHKCAVGPFEKKEVESKIVFGEGFSGGLDLLDIALAKGVITKTGNTHFFNGEKLGMIGKVRELMKDPSFNERVKGALDGK